MKFGGALFDRWVKVGRGSIGWVIKFAEKLNGMDGSGG